MGERSHAADKLKIAKQYVKATAPAKPGQCVEVAEGRKAGRYHVLEARPYGLGNNDLDWCLICQPLTAQGMPHKGRNEVILNKDHKPKVIKLKG